MPDPKNPNLSGQPYVRGPLNPNIGSITTTPLTTGFPGLRTGRPLSQDDRINLQNRQVDPSEIRPGKTYLSDVASDLTGRYDTVIYGANNEDAWGAQQSVLSKGVNGILKGTNLAATTVVGGFATVGGAISSLFTGRLSDIWDNPVMQGIDKWNEKVDQEYLPNYYTDQEKNANWYSPDNWWTANFLFDKAIKNSGFAVGAIISGNIANSALKATGTAIGQGAAALDAAQSFKAFSPLLKNTARAFSAGKNAEAAALLEGEISSIADITQRTSKMAEIAAQTNQFGYVNSVGRRFGVAAYSQAGESAFEGLQTSNEFRDKLIDQQTRANFGVALNEEQLKRIDETTAKVGKASFLTNMALLTATEYVQLPKLMGSTYASERQAANSLSRMTSDVVLENGQYVARQTAKTNFGKLYNKVKGVGKYVFDLKEMGQEIGQYAVQIGTQNYYNKAFKGDDASVLVDGVLYGLYGTDSSGKGVGALNSKEGLEGGLIGGLTGGVMQARGNYMMSKATKTNTAAFLQELNNAPTYKEAFQYKMDAVNRGVVLQEQQEEAIEQGDELEAKDLNADMMHNYLAPRIKYGKIDMVMDDIKEMRKDSMTPEGLAGLKQAGLANINDTTESFNARLTYFETTAKNTDQIYASTNLRYSGEILKDEEGKPILNDKGQQQRKYSDQAIDQMSYAASKVADYDLRIPQVATLPVSNGIDVQSIVNEELTNPESTALADKLAELDANPEVNTAEVKQDLVDSVELAMRRKEYLKDYNDIIANPSSYIQERVEFEEPATGPKETISIKTKRGPRDIEVGTEYFLGKVVDFDERGHEVYRAPRMIVLGKNDDGTIKVQDSDGVIHDLKESTLEQYNLGKVDSTLKNKKANFYMEHWNTIYEFNFGKKYGKQKGRIEFDPETGQMMFKYRNKKGEIKELEVTGDQFVAKKGFAEPMIKEVGELTAAQQKAKDDFVAQEDPRIQAKREARLQILNDLFDDLADKQAKIDKIIDQKQKELTKAKEEYEALQKEIELAELDKRTKAFKFKAATTRALDNAMRLSRMQEQLEREIESLQLDADEIDATLSYITDMAANIDEYSTNFKDFMDELQDEIIDLEVLQETTQKQITTLSKLARDTQAALDSTIDYISKLISSFESKYPNVPRLMGQDWVDFLKDNPNFLKLKPNYRSDLQMIDDVVAEMEDGDININEQRLKDLVDHLAIMQGSLDEVQQEIEAKEMILNKFKEIADKYKQQQQEEKALQNDEALRAQYLGTNSLDIQSFFGTGFYEASSKKENIDVVGSTVAVTRGKEGETIREHHARANRFGFNMNKFENRDALRGMIVTAATEAAAGVDGLMNYLTDEGRATDSKGQPVNPNKIIALVMVEDNEDGTFTLVDENGVPFTAEQLADPIKNAIFQVFPTEELEATYTGNDGNRERGSMFRKENEDGSLTVEQTSLKLQYNKWRNDRLQEETLPEPQPISESFGIPDYVTRLDDKGKEVRDYDARVPVQETGMLSEGALIEDPVLMVATKNDSITYGKVTFNTPQGRVFLKVPGGLLKLKNRQLNEKEVDTIYDVMLQVTKNTQKDGTTKTAETQYLFNWLKTIVYWGIPRNTQTGERKDNPGYNSIWFEDVTEGNVSSTKLFLSGLGAEAFDFTPSGLELKETEIKAILRGMYNNVNATKVNVDSFKKKYTEIVGIDEEGKPITKDWDNYQSYLLSAEGRTNEEIPLVTQVRPLTDPDIPNKKGIYFTLDSTSDDFFIAKPEPVVTQAPAPVTDATQPEFSTAPTQKVYNLEGENNDYKLANYGIIPFKLNAQEYIDTGGEQGFSITFDGTTVAALMADKDIKTEQDAHDIIYAAILAKLRPQLDAYQTKSKVPAADAPQTTFVLDGLAENTVQIGQHGKIVFTLDGKKFNETKGNQGFNIQFGSFDGEVLKSVADAKDVSAKEAQQMIGDDIYAKAYAQLEALKIPVQPALATPFTPNVPEVVEEEVSTAEEVTDIAKEDISVPAEPKPAKTSKFASRQRTQAPDDSAMRVALAKQARKFQGEDWAKLEEGIKKMLPNVPIYRVKNIIQGTNGRQAWGMLHNGAIYIYENAEVGTVYHEVFEAVWKMFADAKEKEAILKEFASRPGTFVDRETGNTVAYKNATAFQIKEELAEEFRDAVLKDKLGQPIESKSLIGRLFSQLIDFIKSFFVGKDAQRNTKELFNKIGNGYYATFNPYTSQLAYANVGVLDIENVSADDYSDLRVVGIPAVQLHEIIDEMTFQTLRDFVDRDESLFNVIRPRQKELYQKLNVRILEVIGHQADLIEQDKADGKLTEEEGDKLYNDIGTLYDTVDNQWDNIITRHKEKLKTFNIEFDENDELALTDIEKSKDEGFGDARKIDSFRKANGAVKLLLGTLPVSYEGVNEQGERELKVKRSTIGGAILMPADEVFIKLKNKLFDSVDIDDMMNRLKVMAKGDPNFENLYARLTKVSPAVPIDYKKLDWQLVSAFWKSMKSQNADAISVFVLTGGDVIVSDSTLTSAAKQARYEMTNDMIDKIKDKSVYFSYEPKTGRYFATDKIKSMPLNGSDLTTYVALLKELAIEFDVKALKKLNADQLLNFTDAVEGIKNEFSRLNDKGKATTDAEVDKDETEGKVARGIVNLTPKTLNIQKRLMQLGLTKAIIENKGFESTYFNMNGERTQTYIGVNALSNLHNVLSKLNNITELSTNPAYKQYEYLRTDVFTKGSVLLQKMFNLHPTKGTGKRIAGTQNLGKSVYIDGMDNQRTGKKKESSKLTAKERVIQEINLNLDGYYLNLVPGDAAIEWAVEMVKFIDNQEFLDKDYHAIFRDYFMSEVELSRDDRFVVEGKNSKDLRFFKSILGKELHDKIMKSTNSKYNAEELYKNYASEINAAVDEFIEEDAADTEALLRDYGIVYYGAEGLTIDDINFDDDIELTDKTLKDKLQVLSVNYMIANIEMHKLLYSDPYQYSDELKRIKNFNSPRQALMVGSQDVNAALNDVYNKGFNAGDTGYTDMTLDYFRVITLGDVVSASDLKGYDPYVETDGGGYILDKANRVFGIRSGEWTEDNEAQYRHDMAYYDLVKSGASKIEIEKFDRNSPNVASTYTPRKPIVSGNKQDSRNYNDVVLHKFALLPLSFRLLHKLNPDSNAIKLYDKMLDENIDYAVYESGSKVGAEKISPLYDKNGKFDETPFEDANAQNDIYAKQAVSNIPFSIMGVQAEVPSKESNYVTQGSQITKLVTLDFMQAGVPIDFDTTTKDFNARFIKWLKLSPEQKLEQSELYRDIKHNQDILEAKIEQGYKSLLKKLGLSKTAKGFKISNIKKLTDTLRDEILKREVNDNITDAFRGFESGDTVLEATPAYQQIRNILYSIADTQVSSPKIKGGMKVQVPSTLLESERPGQQVVKGKNVYSSNLLKFYTRNENGKSINVCQIMVAKWFKSDMSDEELINYFNNDPEGKKQFEAIMGVAFRIPTQKQNSIDVFEIAKFLPEGYKDSVVIPSELVMKAGSDFDIDKLSIYLKNIYPGNNKKPKVVSYLGTGEEAIKKFGELYDKGEFNEYLNSKKFLPVGEAEDRLMESIFPEEYSLQREDVINDLYRQSLENEYMTSLQKIISNDLNFENLIKPNSADDLKGLTDKISKKLGRTKIDYGAVGNMLSRSFMTNLRHAFVTGKYAIGIAAVNQTNHSQNQRSLIYVDREKLETVIDKVDAKWLGDGQVNFKKYNSVVVNGVKRPTLSMIKDADNKNFISDIIGQFIDGYVDITKGAWVMELGASPNVASTWMYLVKLGVPIDTVGYFMNQPIIRDYLKTIQNNGYSWLFIDNFVDDAKYDYLTGDEIIIDGIPGEKELFEMIGKSPNEMSPLELRQQQYILDEFLKYAMMGSHLFQVTQGTNFDTATINDPYLITKKKEQIKKARKTIFSSIDDEGKIVPAVDSILKNSFIGPLADAIYNIRDAYAEILISDRKNVRKVMESVLIPYTNLPDRDFIKVSQKAVNDLFDWAVQNDRKLNNSVKKILLGTSTEQSAARQIIEFRDKVLKDKSHPLFNNMILNSLQLVSGKKIILDEYRLKDGNVYPKENISAELLTKMGYTPRQINRFTNMLIPSPDNISIKGKTNKIYDQNMIIYGFNELKQKLGDENKDLYGKLVRLAVIQSGLTNSPIAFTNLLPYDDFREFYNETLSNLENIPNLADFKTLDTMERSNWNNSNIVNSKRGQLQESKATPGNWYYRERQFLSKKLQTKMNDGKLPEMIVFSKYSREAAEDFVSFTWEEKISKKQRIKARKTGDTSHVNRGLFKKVYRINEQGERVPLEQKSEYKGKEYISYVYKMINAWGDSFRAQEFYGKEFPLDSTSTISRSSILDNGFLKVAREVEDSEIELALLGTTPSITKPEGATLKDGNTYTANQLNSKMLMSMGYNLIEAGEIIKNNKC